MHDISTDEDARVFARELGYSESPVVYRNDEHFAGYVTARLDKFITAVKA